MTAGPRTSAGCPTFGQEGDVLPEAHIFDFDGDIYGAHAAVSFIEYLRPERKFDVASKA